MTETDSQQDRTKQEFISSTDMDKLTPRDDITVQIVFVRHGESYGNVGLPTPEGYDPEDTPLTDKGLRQAQALADYWFDGVEVAHIYSSPFTRTIQTIYPTAQKLGMQIELLPDLLEVGAKIGGCTSERIANDFPLAVPCMAEPSPAGGSLLLPIPESGEQIIARAKRFTDYISQTYQNGETVIVTSHGAFFSHLVRAALNVTQDDCFYCQTDNSAITCVVLRKGGKPLLRTANNTSHLKHI